MTNDPSLKGCHVIQQKGGKATQALHQGPYSQNFFCNFRMGQISWSVCPWQAFPACE
jgi:hypothetical protein